MNTRKIRQDIQDTALSLFEQVVDEQLREIKLQKETNDLSSLFSGDENEEDNDELEQVLALYEETQKPKSRFRKWLANSNKRRYFRGSSKLPKITYLLLQVFILNTLIMLVMSNSNLFPFIFVLIAQSLLTMASYIRVYEVETNPFIPEKEKMFWQIFSPINSVLTICTIPLVMMISLIALVQYFISL